MIICTALGTEYIPLILEVRKKPLYERSSYLPFLNSQLYTMHQIQTKPLRHAQAELKRMSAQSKRDPITLYLQFAAPKRGNNNKV